MALRRQQRRYIHQRSCDTGYLRVYLNLTVEFLQAGFEHVWGLRHGVWRVPHDKTQAPNRLKDAVAKAPGIPYKNSNC